jgi:GT2 family glycosyltransferase
MIKNTFIYNPIRPDFIHRCLETLYQNTDMTDNRVIVVDQTMQGLKLPMDKVHLVLRPHRNLGFSKSMNEGIIHALYWGSEYITCANDDIEYMNPLWWPGILETFQKYGEQVLAVNPMSPREPGWGYGLPHGEVIDLLPYKPEYSQEEYDYLLKGDFSMLENLPATFPKQKNGVIDAIATWHTTFKREAFEKIGLFDERYYPGGGEDYDLNARAYRDSYRMLGTTLSWVWHWWGSSKDHQSDFKDTGLPILQELRWMNPDKIWPPEVNNGQHMDPWGKWTDELGVKHPLSRDPNIAIMDI